MPPLTPDALWQKRIVICCGSGGVGKTTTSAAIALEAARRGLKTLVLTIDPARRLATAMGLDTLSHSPKRIPSDTRAPLYAMMLDTKRTFDRLILRHAPPQEAEKILGNRLYRHMSNMIAGSQEYMAMERLFEIHSEGGYDFIVLDTPPTRHALDFIEAPRRMVRITENSLLKWFLTPGVFSGKMSWGLLQKGAEKILSVFDRLAGLSFLQELAEMISLMGDMLGGFRDRAEEVSRLLHSEECAFLLIASPSAVSIGDALFFRDRLVEEKLPLTGFIINRTHEFPASILRESLDSLPADLSAKVEPILKNYRKLSLREKKILEVFPRKKNYFFKTVPLFQEDVHDLEGLTRMGAALFASGDGARPAEKISR